MTEQNQHDSGPKEPGPGNPGEVPQKAMGILKKVDPQAASLRVQTLREQNPHASVDELIESAIRQKCLETAAIGALTSGTAIVPGLGTLAAVTMGAAADIGLTMKLQGELILEIAALHDRALTAQEQHNALLAVTGINVGTEKLLLQAGRRAVQRISGRSAGKALAKAIPVAGIAASAGTNMLTTYVVGRRSDAYFRLGPHAVGDWTESLRAISGIDERKLATWWRQAGDHFWSATQTRIQRAGLTMGRRLSNGIGAAQARLPVRGKNVQEDSGHDGDSNESAHPSG